MGAPSCFCRIPLLSFRLFAPWSVVELTSLDSLLFQASILRSSLFTLPLAILSFTTFYSGQVYLRNENIALRGFLWHKVSVNLRKDQNIVLVFTQKSYGTDCFRNKKYLLFRNFLLTLRSENQYERKRCWRSDT